MRCECCNTWLTDFESTRRSSTTNEFLNTCNKCLKGLGIATIDRTDLPGTEVFRDAEDRVDEALDPFKDLVEDPLFDDEEFHDEEDSFGF
jgi:hypothetical protein